MNADFWFAIVSNVVGTATLVAGIVLELRTGRQRRRTHLRLLRIELVKFDEAACELAQAQLASHWHWHLGNEKASNDWLYEIQKRQLHLSSARRRLRRVTDYYASPAWVFDIDDTLKDATSIVCRLHQGMMRAKVLLDYLLSDEASFYDSWQLSRSDRPPKILPIESVLPILRQARDRVRAAIAGAQERFPNIPPGDLAIQMDRALDQARADRLAVELAKKRASKKPPHEAAAHQTEPASTGSDGA